MRQRKPDLDAAGAEVLFVTFSPLEVARKFREAVIPGWTCLHDPERRVYARYGLERGAARRVLHPRVFFVAIRAVLRGHRPPAPAGDVMQLGGDFVVDPAGRLRLTHRSEDPADRPSVDSLVELLYGLNHGA